MCRKSEEKLAQIDDALDGRHHGRGGTCAISRLTRIIFTHCYPFSEIPRRDATTAEKGRPKLWGL